MSTFSPSRGMIFPVPADRPRPKEIYEPLQYHHRTPSHGQKRFIEYQTSAKFYWEKRVPRDPGSMRSKVLAVLENNFVKDFDVMFSKNNNRIHPSIREYFDRPVMLENNKHSYNPIVHQFHPTVSQSPVKPKKAKSK